MIIYSQKDKAVEVSPAALKPTAWHLANKRDQRRAPAHLFYKGTDMLVKKLTEFPKKTIEEQELFQLTASTSYEAYYTCVQELVHLGLLQPVRASRLNGHIPPLYNRYHIVKAEEDYLPQRREEIQSLNPLLNIDGYLSNPGRYEKHRKIILPFSRYLWDKRSLLNDVMSINERSFSIFFNEKLLVKERKFITSVLEFNGLPWSFLQCYDTPEPFFSWNLEENADKAGAVLILENKDIWYTLVHLAGQQEKPLFKENITLLVYGEGNKISREQDPFSSYVEQLFGKTLKTVYYAGDVDMEGIRIYERMKFNNPGMDIRLFRPIYQEMYQWAKENKTGGSMNLPVSKDARDTQAHVEEFLLESGASYLFHDSEIRELAAVIRNGGMIPQETVNRPVLMRLLR